MFTDLMEEVCLRGHISLRSAMRLAVANAPTSFTNAEEIEQKHLGVYKVRGYASLPDYIHHWCENSIVKIRANETPAHA